jgi:hypothetical protein
MKRHFSMLQQDPDLKLYLNLIKNQQQISNLIIMTLEFKNTLI